MATEPHTSAGAGRTDASAGGTAQDLRDEAARQARDLRDAATEQVRTRAEGAKDDVADEVSNVGDAFRAASDELRRGSPQEQLFGHLADSLAELSDTLRGRSVGDLVQELGRFGRRNPAAFLGGALALGFAGARIARASRSGRAGAHDDGHPSAYDTAEAYGRSHAPSPTPHPVNPQARTAGTSAQTGTTCTPRPYGTTGASSPQGTASGSAAGTTRPGGTAEPRPAGGSPSNGTATPKPGSGSHD